VWAPAATLAALWLLVAKIASFFTLLNPTQCQFIPGKVKKVSAEGFAPPFGPDPRSRVGRQTQAQNDLYAKPHNK
jgi:hypothetical protein